MKRAALWVGFLLFLLGAGSRFVENTYGAGGREPPRVVAEEVPSGDRARLRFVEGIPVVRLQGARREMGRQYGSIFREQIHYLRREYFHALPTAVVGQEDMAAWARAVEPFLPEKFREELRGLAEGCGLSYEDVLSMNAGIDRFQSALCSTLAASGEATEGGEAILGRNLDFPGRGILHKTTVVAIFDPDDGQAVASVTWPGLLGVLSGMNERGVVGATMMIHRRRGLLKPGLPYLLLYRDALERASVAQDVFDVIRDAPRTLPNNFTVMDASGTSLVVEFDTERALTRPAEEGCVCSTNFFHSRELEGVGWTIGTNRYETLAAFVEARRGSIDLEGVKGVLADVATPWFLNVQSMVFLPARRAIHLSVGGALPAARQPFALLDQATLFGTGTPGG